MLRRQFLKISMMISSLFAMNANAVSKNSEGTRSSTISPRVIAPFGNIDKDNIEEYYSAEILINGSKVEIDLNFESVSIDEPILQTVSNFISDIDSMASKASSAISEDYDLGAKSETARFYLQHHLEELSEEELMSLFGTTEVTKKLFFKALSLYRVGLYPEDSESFAIFDIQFSRKVTDYLMAVTFDANGQLSFISMDS